MIETNEYLPFLSQDIKSIDQYDGGITIFKMLALSHEDTVKLLDMETVFKMVETVYTLKHKKKQRFSR